LSSDPYYRADLARIHHLGFGFHADGCAPGILAFLEPVRELHGTVVEIGCGSGLLTRYLVDAGHQVIATDASPAMLDLAREVVPDAQDVVRVTLPDDPIPAADAIVGVGHALNYLPDQSSLERALVAIAGALQPGGLLAIDLCGLDYGAARRGNPSVGRVGDDWAIVTEFPATTPDHFVRQMATFTRNDDGSWRRDDERHDNVLVDIPRVLGMLAEHGIDATADASFGSEPLPSGLYAIKGRRTP
jgi:SAM-dependent methyltransferase